jgi:exopolysaccharide biosynthesis polyprenyl glycosylphosphotransferase
MSQRPVRFTDFRLVKAEYSCDSGANIPVVMLRNCRTERFTYRFCKRLLDLCVGVLALVLLAPLLALIAVALKLSSSAPVLFKQQRVGQFGRKFWIYKFTTMTPSSADASDTRWTVSQDERVTRLGRILRPTGLDELPQLINVLRGDMSLVGPRPERPHFVEIFRRDVPGYMKRHALKPGITGWAQVCGWRGDTSIRKRVKHDLYYLRHWTFWFDLKILCLTVLGKPAGTRVNSPSPNQVKSASNSG